MKKRILCIITAFFMLLPAVPQGKAYAESSAPQTSAAEQTEPEDFTEPEYSPAFTIPSQIRGVELTPSIDFAISDNQSEKQVLSEAEKILDDLESKKLNSIIINTDNGKDTFYSSDFNQTASKPAIEVMIDAAKNRGFYVYLTFNINLAFKNALGDSYGAKTDSLTAAVNGFVSRNTSDGIILNGYYSNKSLDSYESYMNNGSGIGWENWLYDRNEYIFEHISSQIHSTDNTIPVGIEISDVWSNRSDANAAGSATSSEFEALSDGFADTLDYINKKYADFIYLDAKGSLADKNIPFAEFTGWWSEAASKAEIPLITNISNEKICTNEAGWQVQDQLVKQLIKLREYKSCIGNTFNSYRDLCANRQQSTDAVLGFYSDSIDEEALNKDLKMIMPSKLEYSTAEPNVRFMGSFDRNFNLTFNDEVVKLSEEGDFLVEKDLNIGLNTFIIKNKGKTYTYKITRKVELFKQGTLDPSADMTVDGGIIIEISVYAYKGSNVSASVNGKNVAMNEVQGNSEQTEANSAYVLYTGSYNAPDGKEGISQDLGRISVYGTYNGISQSLKGGKVTVAAAPVRKTEEVKENDGVFGQVTDVHESTDAKVEITNKAGTGSGIVLKIKADNTIVFDPKTTGTIPSPNYSRMAAGTLDFLYKTVYYSSGSYYITKSGRRIKTDTAQQLSKSSLSKNTILAASSYMQNGNTVIKLSQEAKTGYNISFSPFSYEKNEYGDWGDYFVDSFSPTEVRVTFDYCTAAGGSFDFSSSSLFKGSGWSTTTVDGSKKIQLSLKLRQGGMYSGVKASYDNEGSLILSFNGYEKSLSGMVIVIDPGHGYTAAGVYDPGALGNFQSSHGVFYKEATINQALSKLITKKLEAAGAKVIRFKTETDVYDTRERANIARKYNPDLYLSLHADSGTSYSKGNSAYYFTPFSASLAEDISSSVGKYYQNNVYGGSNYCRGTYFDYYSVTTQQEFPSVLLEMGYISNYTEASIMSSSKHQNGIADAVVQGIKNYLGHRTY